MRLPNPHLFSPLRPTQTFQNTNQPLDMYGSVCVAPLPAQINVEPLATAQEPGPVPHTAPQQYIMDNVRQFSRRHFDSE